MKTTRLIRQLDMFTALLKKAKTMENVVSQLEAAHMLGVRQSTIANWRERGLLHDLSNGIGRSRFYAVDELKSVTPPKNGRPKKQRRG